jgi:hypothetical protein
MWREMARAEQNRNAEPHPEWEIWYQDTFDRECPRQVQVDGRGLVEGLVALWARHLCETVQANGQQGFSRFNLWWKQEHKSIAVVGEWDGLVRLRGWVYGGQWSAGKGSVETGDRELLTKVARAHKNLILRGATSEEILAAARESGSRDDFEQRLQCFA